MSTRWAITYRPKRFAEVIGQRHVVKFFKTVLQEFYEKRTPLPMGALFGGHSGVGKTTLARVIAASLNCEKREGVEPCGMCPSCRQIIEGAGGVMEIDASFFGLVDNIRNLRDRLSSYSFEEYQVVIIDECHMLSREASNVLLKLFEEPPERVLFLLCTTEVGKILETVRSRLLEFRFTIIPIEDIVEYVKSILAVEKVTCSDELVRKLYFQSNYNLRDILVVLEQLSLLGHQQITEENVKEVFGDVEIYAKIITALRRGEYDVALQLYDEYVVFHSDFKMLIDNMIRYLGEWLRQALMSGAEEGKWYAFALRTIYNFIANRLERLSGASAARMLFFLLSRPSDGKIAPSEVISVPTSLLRGEELFDVLTGT